jgi:hypothetical protein
MHCPHASSGGSRASSAESGGSRGESGSGDKVLKEFDLSRFQARHCQSRRRERARRGSRQPHGEVLAKRASNHGPGEHPSTLRTSRMRSRQWMRVSRWMAMHPSRSCGVPGGDSRRLATNKKPGPKPGSDEGQGVQTPRALSASRTGSCGGPWRGQTSCARRRGRRASGSLPS